MRRCEPHVYITLESRIYSRSERYSEDPVFGSNLRMTLLLYNNKISPGRAGDRPLGRGFDEPGFGPGPHRGEGMRKKYPNVHQGKVTGSAPILYVAT
uniref:Uncharacterized protein n=1 Tax=Salix viminalis TaxID=40686 RepID=A0A6N2KTW5_SALVM